VIFAICSWERALTVGGRGWKLTWSKNVALLPWLGSTAQYKKACTAWAAWVLLSLAGMIPYS
jgi:hypothetical protein